MQPDLDLGLLARVPFEARSLFGAASAFGLGFALGAGLRSAIIPHCLRQSVPSTFKTKDIRFQGHRQSIRVRERNPLQHL